jgi:hypothetical protein
MIANARDDARFLTQLRPLTFRFRGLAQQFTCPQEAPLGLSPNARLVAEMGGGAVLLGAAAGGPMRTIATGNCASTSCPYGPDPSFAWSPDSRRLAVAVNLARPPTLLKVVDGTGHPVRAHKLPEQDADRGGGRAYFHLVSWSPHGSRLLLIRKDPYINTGVVAHDVATGALRTLARIEEPHDSPSTLAWSPNGRFIPTERMRRRQGMGA